MTWRKLYRALFCGALGAGACSADGQIVTDGSLGAKTSLTGSRVEIPENLGRRAGGNLFHSFEQFNIRSGQKAAFTGAASIQNVISRVTGGTPSAIDGILASEIKGADVYLINPAGVIFGPGSQIDVSGSFAATTAESLKFSDGSSFHAKHRANETLTVAPVSAFGFLPAEGAGRRAGVEVRGGYLIGAKEKSVTLAGGDVGLSRTAYIEAPGGAVQIAAVSEGAGDVPVAGVAIPEGVRRGNVTIEGGAEAGTGDVGAGRFVVRAGDLKVSGGALGASSHGNGKGEASVVDLSGELAVEAGGAIRNESRDESQNGGLDIRADRVAIRGGQLITEAKGASEGGDIRMFARHVLIREDGSLRSHGSDTARSGSIQMEGGLLEFFSGSISGDNSGFGRAGAIRLGFDEVKIGGEDLAFLTAENGEEEGFGDAGDITISAKSVVLGEGASISSTTWGKGKGGAITILTDSFRMDFDGNEEEFPASIEAESFGERVESGAAGDISIRGLSRGRVGSMVMRSGWITTSSYGPGSAGDIVVEADQLDMIGAQINSNPQGDDGVAKSGAGGDIRIRAGKLRMLEGAALSSDTTSSGSGGSIFVDVGELNLDESWMTSGSSALDVVGHGGSILITSGQTQLKDSFISSETGGFGNGGDISIRGGPVRMSGNSWVSAGVFSLLGDELSELGNGRSGSIVFAVDSLDLADGSFIDSSTDHLGNGGAIRIDAGERMRLNTGSITSETTGLTAGAGAAGDIEIRAKAVEILGESWISSETWSQGKAGDIKMEGEHLALSGNDTYVSSSSSENIFEKQGRLGDAGNVELRFDRVSLRGGAGILSFSAGDGRAGNILMRVRTDLELLDGSEVTVESEQSSAGTIDIEAGGRVTVRDSWFVANAFENGGNLRIRANILGLISGLLGANAELGDGGRIEINADLMYQLAGSEISAISRNDAAQPGSVRINNSFDVAAALTSLKLEFAGEGMQLLDGCFQRNPRGNNFSVRGKGGVRASPSALSPLLALAEEEEGR